MVLLCGGIVRTELELELQEMRSILRLSSISFIFCSLSSILSLISRSIVANDDIWIVSSTIGSVLLSDEGTSSAYKTGFLFLLKIYRSPKEGG